MLILIGFVVVVLGLLFSKPKIRNSVTPVIIMPIQNEPREEIQTMKIPLHAAATKEDAVATALLRVDMKLKGYTDNEIKMSTLNNLSKEAKENYRNKAKMAIKAADVWTYYDQLKK